ncbi:hypothetical protein [Proteus mirabilis]|uniref:hypothetical protein n=1 Tax=Proteus mirabilis TaxID=584 RepID=UPI0034D75EC2
MKEQFLKLLKEVDIENSPIGWVFENAEELDAFKQLLENDEFEKIQEFFNSRINDTPDNSIEVVWEEIHKVLDDIKEGIPFTYDVYDDSVSAEYSFDGKEMTADIDGEVQVEKPGMLILSMLYVALNF